MADDHTLCFHIKSAFFTMSRKTRTPQTTLSTNHRTQALHGSLREFLSEHFPPGFVQIKTFCILSQCSIKISLCTIEHLKYYKCASITQYFHHFEKTVLNGQRKAFSQVGALKQDTLQLSNMQLREMKSGIIPLGCAIYFLVQCSRLQIIQPGLHASTRSHRWAVGLFVQAQVIIPHDMICCSSIYLPSDAALPPAQPPATHKTASRRFSFRAVPTPCTIWRKQDQNISHANLQISGETKVVIEVHQQSSRNILNRKNVGVFACDCRSLDLKREAHKLKTPFSKFPENISIPDKEAVSMKTMCIDDENVR